VSEPTIDRTRLPILAQMKDAGFGAASKADAVVTDLRHEARALRDEKNTLLAAKVETFTEGNEKKRRLDGIQARLDAKMAEIHEAEATRDAARERANASAQLYDRCADFLGVSA
jgi:hypothetical protein